MHLSHRIMSPAVRAEPVAAREEIRLENWLTAGQTRTLQFPVGPNERHYRNAAGQDWLTDSSTFDLWVGGDSTAQLSTTFEVTEA
jgi:hypothetical protein